MQGKVLRQYRRFYVVEVEGEEYLCNLASKLAKDLKYPEAASGSRKQRVESVRNIKATSPVVVGDEVVIEQGTEEGMILEVLPRTSTISREHPGRRRWEQILAANVDLTLAVVSVKKPDFNVILLDRVLCSAEYQGINAAICLNKTDMGVDDEIREMLAVYPDLGYPVVEASALEGTGLDDLKDLLRGKTSIAIGLSGVGKSSLLNAVEPGLDQKVGAVNRKSGKGRHTTTTTSLFPLSFGGYYVDVPGVKELSLWGLEPEETVALFPEIRELHGECRFGGRCTHRDEPECVVTDAVERGEIAPHRYKSYLRMFSSADNRPEKWQ